MYQKHTINFMELKDSLGNQSLRRSGKTRVIIHGPTHTGKTDLLRFLVPEKNIIHSEKNVRIGINRCLNRLDLKNMDAAQVIGIDEAEYVESESITTAIRIPSTVVFVFPDMSRHRSLLSHYLDSSVVIDTSVLDLRQSCIYAKRNERKRFIPRIVIN